VLLIAESSAATCTNARSGAVVAVVLIVVVLALNEHSGIWALGGKAPTAREPSANSAEPPPAGLR
jgi:hypothetical protein